MKRSAILFVLILILNRCFTQQNFSNAVGLIAFYEQSSGLHYGTGSLVLKQLGHDNLISIFLVTCKHVLPTSNQSNIIDFIIKKSVDSINTSTEIIIPIYDKNGRVLPNIHFDKDGNDVVSINVTKWYDSLKHLNNSFIPYDALTITDSIDRENLQVGTEVLFVGYPSLFYDKRNTSPILRTAVISTNPFDDFYYNDILRQAYLSTYKADLSEKLNGFLIDANATAGSSGSLVFTKLESIRLGPGRWPEINRKPYPYVLGMLSLSFTDLDSRAINQKINLGAVISSKVIKNTIDLIAP